MMESKHYFTESPRLRGRLRTCRESRRHRYHRGGHSHRLQGDFTAIGLGEDDPYGIKVNGTYVVQAGFHALTMGHCVLEFDENGQATMLNGQNELLLGRRIFWDSTLNQQLDQGVFETACDFIHGQPNVVVCKKHPETQAILRDKYIPRVRALQSQVIAHVENKSVMSVFRMSWAEVNLPVRSLVLSFIA